MVELLDFPLPLQINSLILFNKILGSAYVLPYATQPALIALTKQMAQGPSPKPVTAWEYVANLKADPANQAAYADVLYYSKGDVLQIATKLATQVFIGHSWDGAVAMEAALETDAVGLENPPTTTTAP